MTPPDTQFKAPTTINGTPVKSSARPRSWIGVDLDATMAHHEHVGDPVPFMLGLVKHWLEEGIEVRIFTARVFPFFFDAYENITEDNLACCSQQHLPAHEAAIAIKAWCEKHFGYELPVTCRKDQGMVDLWDDRAVQVVPGTGLWADRKATL